MPILLKPYSNNSIKVHTMLSRTASTVARRAAARCMSTEAEVVTKVKLNFSLPHETVYSGAEVYSVILPGVEGEYGVTANHVPYVAQLKPGLMQILHEESGADPEKYFVAGGYAFTHVDSTTACIFVFQCPTVISKLCSNFPFAFYCRKSYALKPSSWTTLTRPPSQSNLKLPRVHSWRHQLVLSKKQRHRSRWKSTETWAQLWVLLWHSLHIYPRAVSSCTESDALCTCYSILSFKLRHAWSVFVPSSTSSRADCCAATRDLAASCVRVELFASVLQRA